MGQSHSKLKDSNQDSCGSVNSCKNLWKANWLNESRAIKIPIIFDSEIPFLGLDPKAIAPKTERKKKMFAMVLFIIAKTKQQKWKQPICPFIGKERNLLGEPSGSMPLMNSTWPHGGILSQGGKWQLHRKLCRLDFQSSSWNDGDCGL